MNDAGGRFAIDYDTGVVTVANGALIDYETTPDATAAVLAAIALQSATSRVRTSSPATLGNFLSM